jgi:hypothetical protein
MYIDLCHGARQSLEDGVESAGNEIQDGNAGGYKGVEDAQGLLHT